MSEIYKFQKYFNNIQLKLNWLRINLESDSSLGLYEANIASEDFFADLFSIIRNSKYENINKTKKNAPAIDLINKDKKIGIQVTATNTSNKITNTIKKFKKYKYPEKGYSLEIFILTQKEEYGKSSEAKIYDMSDLIAEIYKLSSEQKKAISDLIDKNLITINLNHPFDTTEYNIYKAPHNLNRMNKICELNWKNDESEYSRCIINKYIDILKIVPLFLRMHYSLFAKIMFKHKHNPEIVSKWACLSPNSVIISVIKSSVQTNQSIDEVIDQLEKFQLIFRGENENNDETIVFRGVDNWTYLIYDILDFCYKTQTDPSIFFENLDFSSLEE